MVAGSDSKLLATPSCTRPGGEERQRLLPDVIEDLGYGPGNLLQLLCGGGVYLANGAELLLIGSVTPAIAEDWDLGPSGRGSVVTAVFVGVLFGNLAGGWIGDEHGRRLSILCSYVLVGVFSALGACAPNVVALCVIRVFVGVAFGIGVPAWNALASETVPSRWRMANSGASIALFSVGEAYGALLIWASDPQMRHLDWRWLLMMGVVPAVLLALGASVFLLDSPYYLALRGGEPATQVLKAMARRNGRTDAGVEFVAAARVKDAGRRSFGEQLAMVCRPEFAPITAVLCFSCFVLNFVYYGGLYAFPLVFADLDTGTAPALNVAIGALWEVPGVALGVACSTFMGRKPVMLLSLTCMCACLAVFASVAGLAAHTPATGFALHAAYVGVKLFISGNFLVFYVYATEVYPTEARTTGSAACIASGRLGSITCPLLYEHLREWTGDFRAFFYLMAAFCALNAACVAFLPETRGKRLGDAAADVGSAHDEAADKGVPCAAEPDSAAAGC